MPNNTVLAIVVNCNMTYKSCELKIVHIKVTAFSTQCCYFSPLFSILLTKKLIIPIYSTEVLAQNEKKKKQAVVELGESQPKQG